MKYLRIAFISSLLLSLLPFSAAYAQEKSLPSAQEIAKNMAPGWNLGNTLDALGGETSWQDTYTTQEIINYVKSVGFHSVRIPCCWYIYLKDGHVDPLWMKRVKEVVDYCMKAGLYVILNDHWDEGWIEVEGFSRSAVEYKPLDKRTIQTKIAILKLLWTEIANEFRDYDEHLLFAGLNEPMQEYSLFNGIRSELTTTLLRYNQAFVDAVRSTGGNNLTRTLIVQGPGTNIDDTYNYFSMPDDINDRKGYLAAEVHFYDPWEFTGGTNYFYWGKNNVSKIDSEHNSTQENNEEYVDRQFEKMHEMFVKKGVPVIVGEYAAYWRDLKLEAKGDQDCHNKSIHDYYYTVNSTARKYGLIPFVWDINAREQNGIAGIPTVLDRKNLSIYNKFAYNGIMEAYRK